MKRLIRNRANRTYLAADGGWGDFRLAKHFPDAQGALIACREYGVTEAVEMVLTLGETPCDGLDVALPLSTRYQPNNSTRLPAVPTVSP